MAETNTQTPPRAPTGKPARSVRPMRVDLLNPTRARRVIDCGLDSHVMIVVEPGEVKREVEIAEWVMKELQARTKGRKNESADLNVYPAGKAPDPSRVDPEEDEDEDPDTED